MYYFYCPNCGFDYEIDKLPKGTVGNIRDGYGVPIHHFECSRCHNLDAGFMRETHGDIDEKPYFRTVIERYQGIRGFKE